MNDRNEMILVLPEKTIKALGLDEDTIFETYFEDGKIIIHVLDKDEVGEVDEFEDDDIPEECLECPHFCWRCGVCTLDE